MKKILYILLLISSAATAQVKVGADGGMHPTGNYGVAQMSELKGFSLSVADLTARNAIPANMREAGMLVVVRADTSIYTLVGGITNANWVRYRVSAGNGVNNIDSIFITNTDSIFIINGNDTIFIGESDAMDTAYSRTDSIFGVKKGAEFLISTVQQSIDSIFITASDSIFIITNNNDTIFIGTASNGGASMQSAYDSSQRAGDNPTINTHGNDLAIDSLGTFSATTSPNVSNANVIGFLGINNVESGLGLSTDTLNAGMASHFFSGDIEATLGAARHDVARPDASHVIRVHPDYIKLDAGSGNAKIIASVDTLLTVPTMVYVPDADTMKLYPFPSGSGGSGASLQSAFDSSIRAGDNPTINAHNNELNVDSLTQSVWTANDGANQGHIALNGKQSIINNQNDSLSLSIRNSLTEGNASMVAFGLILGDNRHFIDVYKDSVVFHSGNDTTQIKVTGLDSADADVDNMVWVDPQGFLHRGHLNGGGGSSGLANFYLKDSSLSSDRTVDLNGHTLAFVGVDSSDVNATNVMWMDSLGVVHRGYINTTGDTTSSNQPLFGGTGMIPFIYDGSTPITANVDVAYLIDTINSVIGTDTTIFGTAPTYIVDSIINDPVVSPVNGSKFLIGTAPTGVFVSHANQIVEYVGTTPTYTTADTGQFLQTVNPLAFYQWDGTIWTFRNKAILVGYKNYGGNIKVGTYNSADFTLGTKNRDVIRLDTNRNTYLIKYKGTPRDLYYLGIDSATGRIDTLPFHPLIAGTNITISGDTINATGGGGSGSVTSVATNNGTGITGGTITTTGTIAADTASVLSTKAHVTDVLQGYVPTTRTISTTSPLSGGGDLSANRTLSLGVVPIANGGTNNGSLSVTNGNLLYTDGSKVVALGVGTAGQHLLGGTLPHWVDTAAAGGGGSVTSFSAGNLSPLFTTSVATATSTPALTFALSNAGAYTLFGRAASTGAPSFLASIDSNWIPTLHSEAYYNTKYITTADGTPFALTMNNSGTGNASGSTFNGTAARTLSYNSIGAQAALSGTGYVSFSGTTPSYVATITPTTGGTGISTYTTGDILYASATNTLSKLGIGAANQPLTVSAGGIPQWGSYISQDSVIVTAANLGTTLSNRLIVRNPTLSTSPVPVQSSPRLSFLGSGFYTSAAHEQVVTIGLNPSSSSASPRPFLVFSTFTDGTKTDSVTIQGSQITANTFIANTGVTTNSLSALGNSPLVQSTTNMNATGDRPGFNIASQTITKTSSGTYTAVQIVPTLNEVASSAANIMFKINPTLTSEGSGGTVLMDIGHDNTSVLTVSKAGALGSVASINAGTLTPDASAVLQAASTTQGFLLPRMTKTQRNAIASPTAGLVIYQTDNTPGIRVYNGTNWMKFTETTD